MIRLLIDTTSLLREETGIGRYTRQIATAAASSPNFETFFSPCDPWQTTMAKPGFLARCKSALAPHPLLYRTAKSLFAVCRRIASWAPQSSYDCYFEPNYILRPSVRTRTAVITIHDLSCFRYPQWHTTEHVRHMEQHFRTSLARADQCITVSEAVRQEVLGYYNIPETNVVAIPNGVDHAIFRPVPREYCAPVRQKYHLPEHFILHVGTLEPRKNLHNLLLAHGTLPLTLQERYPLLLAGSSGWGETSLHDAIKAAAHVRWLGYVPDEELAFLYNLATVMAYPSWYEGFGLPVAEAMASGCPVLTSTDPALLETAGGAARHVAPNDVDALRQGLQEMLEDASLRVSLREAGLQRATAFTWKKTALLHLQLFQTLCTAR